jgi:hypothetical protein
MGSHHHHAEARIEGNRAVFVNIAGALAAAVVLVHSAAGAQAGTNEAVACVPACSPGYGCFGGQCKSLCNPACGPGETCVEQRYCALIGPAGGSGTTAASAASPAAEVTAPEQDQRQEEEWLLQSQLRRRQLNLQRRAEREQSRLIPRMTVMAGLTVVEPGSARGPQVTALALRVGRRTNFTPHFGAHVEGGADLGAAFDDYVAGDNPRAQSDMIALYSLAVSGGFFFNFARAYAGPVMGLEWRSYGRDTFNTGAGVQQIDRTGSRLHTSVGGQFGLLFLARDQLDVNARLSFLSGDNVAQYLVLAGYHFLP